jgi:hypothetical protein
MDRRVRVADPGREASPSTELSRRGETGDVADLGHERHRREQAHTGQTLQRFEACIRLGTSTDLALDTCDRLRYRIEEPTEILNYSSLGVGKLDLGQPGPARTLPQGGRCGDPRDRRAPPGFAT